MKVSYNWLQTYFSEPLPPAEEVSDALTFHAWEIEEMEKKDDDTVIDVKVLPDKSAWALSHRGIAKDLAVILSRKLLHDPLSGEIALTPLTDRITLRLESPKARRYTAALIEGVTVKDSPDWLIKRLLSLGQKPINNIVDATNYVMFNLGQPLHAFDVQKLGGENISIVVRDAKENETIETLGGESRKLTVDDLLITDGPSGAPLGIAGVKGGTKAAIDASTTSILIESANFDPVSVRKTAKSQKLRTDASARFENGVLPSITPYAIAEVSKLILEIAGGTLVGYQDEYPRPEHPAPVSVPITKINSVLSLSLSEDDIRSVMDRFGYPNVIENGVLTVTPPLERPDLTIGEDLIEEIGRIYGYEHIGSVSLSPLTTPEINKRFYYSEVIRDTLSALGFSEVFTSSFRNKDTVKLANALASDKGYLRSSLSANLDEALARNTPLADLLGVREIKIFEIGTVFAEEGEHLSLGIGVRSPGGYKSKTDDPLLIEAITSLGEALGVPIPEGSKNGIAEINLDALLKVLNQPNEYRPFEKGSDPTYQSFSPYPFSVRDIALWVPDGVTAESIDTIIRETAGTLLVRLSLFDRFEKEGKVSYAFRLVLQSFDQTLTEAEIIDLMERVTIALKEKGWEIR